MSLDDRASMRQHLADYWDGAMTPRVPDADHGYPTLPELDPLVVAAWRAHFGILAEVWDDVD